MSKGNAATQAKETEDLFPVRDIETDRRVLVIPRSPTGRTPQSMRNNAQEVINFSLNLEGLTLPEMGEKLFIMSQVWYVKASNEANKAIHDIKNTWNTTTGTRSKKTKVTSRLVMYYLIMLALYIIKSCFWVDRKLLDGLKKMLLKAKKNTQMLIGLGIVLSLILVAYVIGAPCPEPQAVCDK